MITEDARRTAEAAARTVGIEKVLAAVRPEDKASEGAGLQAQGCQVAVGGHQHQSAAPRPPFRPRHVPAHRPGRSRPGIQPGRSLKASERDPR